MANPDALRLDATAVSLVKAFVEPGLPVAAICHAPWVLVEADVLRGRRLTSWPSLMTDIRNAGGDWVDEPVVVDGNLITSRNPDDLPAFISALPEAVNHGVSSAAASVEVTGGQRLLGPGAEVGRPARHLVVGQAVPLQEGQSVGEVARADDQPALLAQRPQPRPDRISRSGSWLGS